MAVPAVAFLWAGSLVVGLWVWVRTTSVVGKVCVLAGLLLVAWVIYTWVPRVVGDDLPDGAVYTLLLFPLLGLIVWRKTHRQTPGTRS